VLKRPRQLGRVRSIERNLPISFATGGWQCICKWWALQQVVHGDVQVYEGRYLLLELFVGVEQSRTSFFCVGFVGFELS
jgi:hypothetical protein